MNQKIEMNRKKINHNDLTDAVRKFFENQRRSCITFQGLTFRLIKQGKYSPSQKK